MSNQKPLHIAEDLEARLSILASKDGHTLEELADSILREHADSQERAIIEKTEDERRWQRYLESGQTISLDTVRGKLHTLAQQAAFQSESQ